MSAAKRHEREQPERGASTQRQHVLHGKAADAIRERMSQALGVRTRAQQDHTRLGQRAHLYIHEGGLSGCLLERGKPSINLETVHALFPKDFCFCSQATDQYDGQ